ncbi:MAG: M48 family metalloprotease, partial [Bacillota bacterium]
MNPVLFRTLFGGLFLFKIAVKTGLDLLNWSHIRQNAANIPGSLQNLVTPPEIARINDYNIAKIRFRLIFSLFNSLLLLVFFFSPLYPGFTGWIAALPAAFIFKGLAFFLILGFCGWILDLPFNFFYHFRIEAAFGFNKYSIAGWFKDELKTLAIGSVLTIVILSIIFSIWADPFSFRWGYVFLGWSIALVLVVLFMYLVPLILIPLFYKLTPLEDQDLGEKIAGLFQRSGLKVRGIFQADESSKSTHANAMIAGFGRSKTIILFDTLVNNYSREEIAAIIAHEIGHGKRRHIFQLMALTIGELFLFILFASYL